VGYLRHSGSSALPRTFVGRWLRAAMLDQRDERDRLVRTLNGGSATGWNDDEPAVVEAAAELVLRRFYGTGIADAEEVTRLASATCVSMAEVKRPLSQQHAELVIRSALGETAAGYDALSSGDRFLLQMAVTSLASIRMELDEALVDEVLREAERIAFERGYHPPLVLRRGGSGAERP
jgi:hypothetical protein